MRADLPPESIPLEFLPLLLASSRSSRTLVVSGDSGPPPAKGLCFVCCARVSHAIFVALRETEEPSSPL